MAEILITDLTEGRVNGTGTFDKLMQAVKAHLEEEFKAGRIKGSEYSTVYLGALTTVLQQSADFLLTKEKISLEVQMLEQQVILTQAQVAKMQAEVEIAQQQVLVAQSQVLIAQAEVEIAQANAVKIPAEVALLGAQKLKVDQEVLKLAKEVDIMDLEEIRVQKELLVMDAQIIKANADAGLSAANKLRAEGEVTKIPHEIALLQAQKTKLDQDILLAGSQTSKVDQDALNAVTEGANLVKQGCLLDAQYEVTMEQKLKVASETTLMSQKLMTERAQTTATGVDDNSVVGRQKALYQAQANGFIRDAEQKAAKILTETWQIRRTTDETNTPADTVNKLNDTTIGRVIDKLLVGVGA